jgi:heat shock protein HtpX
MQWDGRSRLLLIALALVAVANGTLLGFSVYGTLAAALTFLELSAPPSALGVALGGGAGVAVLIASLTDQRKERDTSRGRPPDLANQSEASLTVSMDRLTKASTLDVPPTLCIAQCTAPNAFAVGRSRDEASIVLTTGLLALLCPAEQEAVLAHELSHVEAEDIKAVGRADAIADTVERAGRLKGRFLWGPKRIFRAVWPAYAGALVLGLALMVLDPSQPNPSPMEHLLIFVLGGIYLLLVRSMAKRFLVGSLQMLLFVGILGPLTLIEAALAAPTALALACLISRTREYAADRRAVDLTNDIVALISALERLRDHSSPPAPVELREVRFALFVRAREGGRLHRLLARLYATHPPIEKRIEALRALTHRARAAAAPG